jgi:ComF family protein
MRNTFGYRNVLISRFLNILYPSKCPLCGKVTDILSYSPICCSCWSKIDIYKGPSCKICALPLSSEYSGVCGQCIKKPPPFSRVISYGLYEGVLAEAINQLKFYGIKRLSNPLGRLLLNIDLPEMDGLIPVPLSIKRLRERGFNQSLLIARFLSKNTNISLLMDNLFKIKETLPQIGLSARERLQNIKNAFEVKGNIKGLRLLLLDDVMTTGATVTECSKQLMKAGAKEVVVLTLARAGMM